jgi:hypothetical protein
MSIEVTTKSYSTTITSEENTIEVSNTKVYSVEINSGCSCSGASSQAINIAYDNLISGLLATNVQEAIDETKTILDNKIDKISSVDNNIVRFNGLNSDVSNSGVIIDDDVRVGVDELAPKGRLHVNGSNSNNEFIAVFCENGITPEASDDIKNLLRRTLSIQGNGAAYFMGRDVVNNIEYVMGTSILNTVWVGSVTNHPLQLRTKNITKMHITTDGDVGIGTENPNEKLEVNGKIKATSINFTNLPTSDIGLSSGNVWNDNNTLKIIP